jgi:hypothetical protein
MAIAFMHIDRDPWRLVDAIVAALLAGRLAVPSNKPSTH